MNHPVVYFAALMGVWLLLAAVLIAVAAGSFGLALIFICVQFVLVFIGFWAIGP